MKNISKITLVLMTGLIALNNTAESISLPSKKTVITIAGSVLATAAVVYGAYALNKSINTVKPVPKPSTTKMVAKGIGTGILAGLALKFGVSSLASAFILPFSAMIPTGKMLLSLGAGRSIGLAVNKGWGMSILSTSTIMHGALSLGTGYGALKLGESTYKDYKNYSA